MRILFTLLLLSIANYLPAQVFYPKNYTYYVDSNKEMVFFDDFVDDEFGWVDDSNSSTIEIKNGVLRYKSLDTFSSLFSMPIDFNKDFEISLKLKIESEKIQKSDFVIGWGVNCGVFKSSLAVGKNYAYCYNQEYGEYDKRTYDFERNYLEKYNWYTIRKTGGNYYAFVNSEFRLSHPAIKNRGTDLSLYVSKNDYLIIDSIKAYYLHSPVKNNTTPIFRNSIADFQTLVYNNIRYSRTLKDDCINCQFLVAIRINKNGNVDSVIAYGAKPLLNAEIARVFPYTNGLWEPAHINDSAISQWYIMPMSFTKMLYCPKAEDFYQKGVEAYQAGDTADNKEALYNFQLAAGTDYNFLKAWYNIITIYTNEQNYPKACEYLRLLEYVIALKAGIAFTEDEKKVIDNLSIFRQNCISH